MRYTAPAGQAGLLSFRRAWKQVPLHELHNTQTEYITMKKTIITLLALAGVASADSTILTFDQTDHSFDTDKWSLNGTPSTAGEHTATTTLNDGTGVSFHISNGRIWEKTVLTNEWVNTEAVSFMNSELGTSLTGTDLTSIKTVASGYFYNRSTLTLDFTDNVSYSNGSEIVFYLLVATSNDSNTAPYKDFSVDGLTNTTVHWANATDEGGFYDNIQKSMESPVGQQILVRVQGTLTETQSVTFEADCDKNAWSMAAYNVASASPVVPVIPVPEPATATLSLLALAGLAARRRRH